MSDGIPINHDVLQWARVRAGYSLSDLIDSYAKYDEWEKGASNPSAAQLDKLSNKLKIPMAVLFFPTPPKEDKIEKSLRAISAEDINTLSPHIRFLFRKGKSFQIYLRYLLRDEIDLQYQKLSWLRQSDKNFKSPADLATQIRTKLDLTIDEQMKWNDSDYALSQWRESFAEHGIYVFKEAFKDDRISGFCIYDDTFPIIFINSSQSKNRQIFTLFHELGHLTKRQNFLDVAEDVMQSHEPQEEFLCNEFAGNFLVPSDSLLETVKYKITVEKIGSLSKLYKVSMDVIARRLFETKIISREDYASIANYLKNKFKNINNNENAKKGGGNYYATQLSYVGEAYCSLVMKQYYQGNIGIEKASEYLNIKPQSFSGLEDAILRKKAG